MARRRPPLARLRGLLLAGLLLAVAAVVGLFLFGRAGRPRTTRAGEEEATQAKKGTTLVGEDFDYTFTEKERPLFRIRGDSIRADREGTLFLDGVALTLYDPQGQAYHVESKQASFNRASNEGVLQGDVVLKGPSDLELRSTELQMQENGKVLFCPQPVEIRYVKQYVVNGDSLRVELPDEIFVLEGKARVRSLPGAREPVAATAQRAIYERQRKLLRIEGEADLRRGMQHLKAQRISAYLSPDEASLVFVRGLWDVAGQSAGPQTAGGAPTVVRFSGKDFAVTLEPQGGNKVNEVDLEGMINQRAMIETSGGGIVRTLTALRLEGDMDAGVLQQAQAFDGVDIKEVVRGPRTGDPRTAGRPATRQAHGKQAQADFRRDGHLAKVELTDEVTYQDPRVSAHGNRGSLDLDADRGDFFGTPVGVRSEKGTLDAPRIAYDTKNQIMHAMGGVRAVLEKTADSDLAGSPLGEGEGPVHVESKEAFWRQTPSSFIFRGEVRAWRGDNLMLSDQLLGEKEQDRLTASGGVKTLWVPTDQQAADSRGDKAGGAGAAKAGETRRSPVTTVVS